MLLYDPPDEEDLDVVLDRDQLRVVDPGFGRQLLVGRVDIQRDRVVSQLRLVLQEPRLFPIPRGILIDDAVLGGSDAFLLARLSLVCRDRSCGRSVSQGRGRTGRRGGRSSARARSH